MTKVLACCRRFSPLVGLEPTDRESVLLDITGLAHLFGGEAALCQAILRDLARQELSARVVIADTIGTAWAAGEVVSKSTINNQQSTIPNPSAFPLPSSTFRIIPPHETSAFLAPLPITALRLPAETVRLLNELGIDWIGQVEALPREELSSRFGPMLLRRLDQAFGRLTEPVPLCPAAPEFIADWSAEYPTSRRETILAALEHLIGQVAAMLVQCGQGVLRLDCRLMLEISNFKSQISHLSLSVGLFQPTAAAKHLLQLVEIQLERLRIPAPISGVQVAATLTAPLEPARQAMLFDRDDEQQCGGKAFAALVERLSSRLGRQSVANVRLRPEAQPELSWHYDPLVEQRRRRRMPKAPPSELPPRPLRLLPRPRLVEAMSVVPDGPPLKFRYAGREEHVAQSWGPERVETGWWRGQAVGRDYFRVETAAGCRYWLFRRLRDGKWFLHGAFE